MSTQESTQGRIALALGGLAGNNFHGAGILQAALDKRIDPVIISCTTGQIYWVYQYLRAKRTGQPASIKDVVETEFSKIEPLGWPDWDFINLFIPFLTDEAREKFRPAFPEWFIDLNVNVLRTITNVITNSLADLEKAVKEHQIRHHTHLFYLKRILNNFPARLLIPKMVMDNTLMQEICDEFNNSDIAIIFNSYAPLDGQEHIYLNPGAQAILNKTPGTPSSFRSYHSTSVARQYYHGDGITRVYEGIQPTSIREALWIYEYGFDSGVKYLDGGYLRDIILSELAKAKVDTIYVARPIKYKWVGNLPETFIERLDLQTEVFFNGSYFGELDRIQMINELLNDPSIGPTLAANGFQRIVVKPMEMERQRGFFDYVFEDIDVFDEAYRLGMTVLP